MNQFRVAALALPAFLLAACQSNEFGDQGSKEDRGSSLQQASAAPAPRFIDPGDLLGLGTAELALRLGKATLIRREGPAEIWQYQATGCVLDAFFYESDGRLHVAHVEAREVANGGPFEAGACLALLARQG